MVNLGNYTVPEEIIGGVCVDIGCNLGDFTNKYKGFFNKIYFFEPQKILFDNLVIRFKDEVNIKGFNLAVWSNSESTIDLVTHKNGDHGSVGVKSPLLNDDWTNNIVNSVKTISLIDLINKIGEEKIDYLKIDCETSEYEFLLNNDLSNIKYIGIELHCQMGEEKYNKLLNWILKTHTFISGEFQFRENNNSEGLFKLK